MYVTSPNRPRATEVGGGGGGLPGVTRTQPRKTKTTKISTLQSLFKPTFVA